jgi:hypothetical protein
LTTEGHLLRVVHRVGLGGTGHRELNILRWRSRQIGLGQTRLGDHDLGFIRVALDCHEGRGYAVIRLVEVFAERGDYVRLGRAGRLDGQGLVRRLRLAPSQGHEGDD